MTREEKEKKGGPQGFGPKVLETFLLKATMHFLEEHPQLYKILECLVRGEAMVALLLIKVARGRENPDSRSPFFSQVERMIYATICPHIDA